MEDNTIICGDCLDIMKDWPDGCVDLVLTDPKIVCITDPPYGVNKANWDGFFPIEWIPFAEKICSRLLVMSGNTNLIYAGSHLSEYKDCICLYAKNGMTRSRIAFGNWFPVLASGDWKWEARPNVLPYIIDVSETIQHPSPKPLNVMLALMKWYTNPDDIILDPFCGSGTTCVAAKMLGRRYIGIDISSDYCEIARDRLRACDTGVPVKEARAGQGALFE